MVAAGAERVDTFVSVVTVLDGTESSVAAFSRETADILRRSFNDYELVLVSQWAGQDATCQLEPLLREIPGVRLIQLANPVSKDVAWAAAMENAIGDFVVLMSIDRDPPDIIVPAVAQSRAGSDVVIGVDSAASGALYGALSGIFHAVVAQWVRYEIPQGATTFRVLSRRAVNAITRTGRFRHVFFVRVSSTGYGASTFAYKTVWRTGVRARKSVRSGLRDAINMLVFNTTAPLRLMSAMGIIGSFLSAMYAVYSIAIRILKKDVVEGWTSLSLVISGLFFVLFTMLFFFGEYLSRLLDEQSDRQDYDVVYEKHSSLMLDEERYNVRTESLDSAAGVRDAEPKR